MMLLLWLLACAPTRTCAEDEDCDGVPDDADRCAGSNAETATAEPTDAAGCTDDQMARCTVTLERPLQRAIARGATTFAWHGTCDVYLLQFSDDPTFPAGRTRTEIRTAEQAWTSTEASRWWRVVGGRTGSSHGFTTDPREIGWE